MGSSLVAQSLLKQTESLMRAAFTMLETIREYALEHLERREPQFFSERTPSIVGWRRRPRRIDWGTVAAWLARLESEMIICAPY